MKKDRELLELAAKAVGFKEYKFNEELQEIWCKDHGIWCPLSDDGDAMRLAHALSMDIDFGACRVIFGDNDDCIEFDGSSGNPETARRAIVRAAAAIGENMQ